jgi:CRP-like cAMP-binding protein
MKEQTIRRIPLFASLPHNEIQYLTETLRVVGFPANSLLLREGEYGDRFFVVLSGAIEIIKALGTSDEKLIDVRGAGEYIGEMSLLIPEGKRTASVRAHTAVQALVMTRADFDTLLHANRASRTK